MQLAILTVIACALGMAVGSFLNVVVFRTRSKESVAKGRSKCMTCLEPIEPIDLIPVWSYFALRGKCRKCSAVIPWQYPAVEMAMGIIFGLFFVRAALMFGIPTFVDQSEWLALFVRDAVIACFLLVIFVYDFKYQYILDRFTVPAMIAALLFNMALGADGLNLLLGGLMIGGFFAFQFLVSKGKWIGGGDIRMGLLMGFLLGIEMGVLALFLSYVLGAIAGLILIATKKRKMDSHVPFGTFMSAATLIVMFCGIYFLNWYLGLLG